MRRLAIGLACLAVVCLAGAALAGRINYGAAEQCLVDIGCGTPSGGTLSSATDQPTVIRNTRDAASNPVCELRANERATPADGDRGLCTMTAENDAGEFPGICRMIWMANDVTDGTEDGQYTVECMRGGVWLEFLRLRSSAAGTAVVQFNDGLGDINFRINSDNISGIIVVDAGLDRVEMGGSQRLVVDQDKVSYNGLTRRGCVRADGAVGGAVMLRDTDDAGWTECTALNGTLSCTTDPDGLCGTTTTTTTTTVP